MSLSLDLGKMMAQRSLVQMQIPLRSQVAWARILDNPTDIVLERQGIFLDPQTVRIEFEDSYPQQVADDSGMCNTKRGVIFGAKGHPEVDDLDIREFDIFVMDEKNYIVVFVNKQLHSEIQADFEAT